MAGRDSGRMFDPVRAAAAIVAAGLAVGCAGRSPQPRDATDASATSKPPDTTSSSDGRTARDVGWVSIAIGGQAAVAAIATSFMMLHDKSVRDGNCDAQKVCSQAGYDANSSLASLGGWNAASWVVAVVGLGAGAYLVVAHPHDHGPQTAVTLSPMGSGAGVGVRSSF